MQVGMHDCMRSKSESELANKLSGILNKTNKQTNMHTCVSVYVCVYEERERISVTLVTTAAQACASHLCMCARVCVCWYYFANLTTVSLHLPLHTVKQKTHTHSPSHTQATLKTQVNACRVMVENQHFHSGSASQYSATRNTHTHTSDESPAKMSGGRADKMLLFKSSTLYRGETESQATSCKVYSDKQTKREQIYTYTHTQECMLAFKIVWGARANQS